MVVKEIKQVAIVGGIHGNELTGVYMVKKFQSFPQLIQRPSFQTLTWLGNPKAIKACQRYIDIDLNRCFSKEDLHNIHLCQYEQLLAKNIYQYFQASQVDFMIDIHSSTANMGLTIILGNEHPLTLSLAASLSASNHLIKVLRTTKKQAETRLRSICPLGITIEVGAVAQGILDPVIFQQTEALVLAILDYVDKFNQQHLPTIPEVLTCYEIVENVDFPRNEQGEIIAMVHPHLHGNDYCSLKPGEPIFVQFDGSVLVYEGKETVYPVFINESAYREKGIAMALSKSLNFEVGS